MPSYLQAFCKAEQQFELYDLLDKCQTLLIEQQPNCWEYYYGLCKQIKEQISLCNKAVVSYVTAGKVDKASCVNLFKPTEGNNE